jgi:hypothetical protein
MLFSEQDCNVFVTLSTPSTNANSISTAILFWKRQINQTSVKELICNKGNGIPKAQQIKRRAGRLEHTQNHYLKKKEKQTTQHPNKLSKRDDTECCS